MLCNILPRHNWAISTGVIPLEGFILSDYRACCGFRFTAAWAHWWTGSSFIYSSWDPFTLILLLLGREEDEETPQSYLKYSAVSFWWWFGTSLVLEPLHFLLMLVTFHLDCATGLGRVWHVGLGGASKDGAKERGKSRLYRGGKENQEEKSQRAQTLLLVLV